MAAFRVAIEKRAPEAPYRPVMGSRRWLLVLEARDAQDAEGLALDHLRSGVRREVVAFVEEIRESGEFVGNVEVV